MKCTRCRKQTAEIELPWHNAAFCKECFQVFFRGQLQKAIRSFKMFTKKDRVLVAVSGGKDSMSLWHALLQNGYNVTALFIHLGIPEFSDTALEKVKGFASKEGASLKVVYLRNEGLAIPDVIRVTRRPACAICGRLKRYYFNRVAIEDGFDVIATGHNLDDEASRLFANLLHWKMEYLQDQSPVLPEENGLKKKVKPFFRLTEFEIAAYAFINKIDFFHRSCPLSKGATFSFYKRVLNRIEYNSPGTKMDFYQGFLKTLKPVVSKDHADAPENHCRICGYPAYGDLCSVCALKQKMSAR